MTLTLISDRVVLAYRRVSLIYRRPLPTCQSSFELGKNVYRRVRIGPRTYGDGRTAILCHRPVTVEIISKNRQNKSHDYVFERPNPQQRHDNTKTPSLQSLPPQHHYHRRHPKTRKTPTKLKLSPDRQVIVLYYSHQF